MSTIEKQFQLLILDAPFERWSDSFVQETFAQMVELKKRGYGQCYASGVLPVDTSDFLSTHVLLCEKHGDSSFTPVMGYKSITLDKCRQYNLNFPGLNLVQSAKMPSHTLVVQEVMDRCERDNKRLAYLGSWTVDPEFKKRSIWSRHLKEAFMAFYRMVYREQNVAEVVIGGTLRFKTEKLFAQLGHRPLSLQNEVLSPIHVVHLVKEPVLVMHSEKFTDVSSAAEEKWQGVWEQRIHVGDSFDSSQIIRVA